MPKTPSLENLAALQMEKTILQDDIARKTERLKEIDRFLRKFSKPETTKITKKSPIEDLKLPARPYQVLKGQQILTVSQLEELTEIDILKMPMGGRKSLNQIKEALEEHNRHLKPNKPLK